MASLDWSQCSAVASVPNKVSGAWVFKDTRTPVSVVFENLEDGMTIDELVEQFPVTREQIRAVLELASQAALTRPARVECWFSVIRARCGGRADTLPAFQGT